MPAHHSPPERPRRGRSIRRLVVATVAALMVVAGLLFAVRTYLADRPEQQLARARQALADENFGEAQELAKQVLQRDPRSAAALAMAAEAAVGQERFDDAIAYWDRIPEGSGQVGADGLCDAGELLLDRLHLASEAERRFRRAIEIEPTHVRALDRLANLLAIEGRTTEAVPLILDLFRQGHVDLDQLTLLGMPNGTINDPELLRDCHVADREDAAILLGLAASVTFRLPPDQATVLLSEAVRLDPTLLDAQARLGKILLEVRDAEAFLAWHRRLPAVADAHPEIWALRAEWARDRGEVAVARRCYWEALRRDPNHRAALYQFGQLLLRAGEAEAAAPLLARGEQLQELRQRQDVLLQTEHRDLQPMRAVAEQLVRVGRLWEAWGWCVVALRMNADEQWAYNLRNTLNPQLEALAPGALVSVDPLARLDFSGDPLPDWQSGEADEPAATERAATAIAFEENAEAVGIDFRYFCNSRPAAEGKRMYEFPGGGVAILDYDLDGWPDIYLTQGAPWPPQETQRTHLDYLARNIDGQSFGDVTAAAAVIEPQFSHGATVGDFNNDGFPDLYIANIGANRLWVNNGDGTFRDVSSQVAGDTEQWTTSCLMADVNGDGLPDLYDVNYVDAPDVFERTCKHADGTPRMCMPFHFPAAPDQLKLNQGDGRFTDATSWAGIEPLEGRGLGIVAGDFDGSGRLSLFIANDTTPNFLLANQMPAGTALGTAAGDERRSDAEPGTDAGPLFVECGVATGLALNANGRAEGCMGIAAGDLNRDGRLDLFIGNFLRESNTLYLQEEGGTFVDATREFGLERPSLDQLAFGTQFLDAELDGDLDLIVANGHVDDVRAYGRPYQMRPQFFENPGAGPLMERDAPDIGDYFAKTYLGRSVARCDWNGDGLEDVVISHLESPAALLTNRSNRAGHFLAVRLVGVESARDAIGATVTVRLASPADRRNQTLVRQLTAGDGYQSSNQRLLMFGLGQEISVDELQINWPAGRTTIYRNLPVDRLVICVEDHKTPVFITKIHKTTR